MALGSTQPLTEMSTRRFPGGKGGRSVRLTTLPPSCAVVMKSGNLNFLKPSGPLQAFNGTALTLPAGNETTVRQLSCLCLSLHTDYTILAQINIIKGKVILLQAQCVGRGIALFFYDHGTRRG